MSTAIDITDEFARLVRAYGNTAELARRAGLSRAAIDYKMRGERRVTRWDVWAVQGALQEQETETT